MRLYVERHCEESGYEGVYCVDCKDRVLYKFDTPILKFELLDVLSASADELKKRSVKYFDFNFDSEKLQNVQEQFPVCVTVGDDQQQCDRVFLKSDDGDGFWLIDHYGHVSDNPWDQEISKEVNRLLFKISKCIELIGDRR